MVYCQLTLTIYQQAFLLSTNNDNIMLRIFMTKKTIDSERFLITNLKALIQEKTWLLDSRLKQKRISSSYKILTDAETRVLAALRGEELTISEIARRLTISRQAVHKIISNLVKENLLKLQKIEGNARDKRIIFTRAGEVMKKEVANLLHELEEEVKKAIGARNFNLLKTLLAKKW
jgi:DNA-binding MarR family transcriptional regulator